MEKNLNNAAIDDSGLSEVSGGAGLEHKKISAMHTASGLGTNANISIDDTTQIEDGSVVNIAPIY